MAYLCPLQAVVPRLYGSSRTRRSARSDKLCTREERIPVVYTPEPHKVEHRPLGSQMLTTAYSLKPSKPRDGHDPMSPGPSRGHPTRVRSYCFTRMHRLARHAQGQLRSSQSQQNLSRVQPHPVPMMHSRRADRVRCLRATRAVLPTTTCDSLTPRKDSDVECPWQFIVYDGGALGLSALTHCPIDSGILRRCPMPQSVSSASP
ncbi:hypothetical protein BD413DRAFT_262810 [Trametes elegans]|nr:hypothetical protein BD413DRAFT_262810 [Trametes elegans]